MNKTPLSIPNLNLDAIDDLKKCLETGMVSTSGEYIHQFEKELTEYTGSKHVITVNSGTSALHVAYHVSGVGYGDEVICPNISFIATINPILYSGAKPIFIDTADNYMLDTQKVKSFLENQCIKTNQGVFNKKTKSQIKAIVVVHTFGDLHEMSSLKTIASKYDLKIIEDAAAAMGCTFTNSIRKEKHAGTSGDLGIVSFNANKIMTSGGGGAILTSNDDLAQKIRHVISQSRTDGIYYKHDEIGFNYKMNNINAVIGLSQLKELEQMILKRKNNHEFYKSGIQNGQVIRYSDNVKPNYWLSTLKFNSKEKRDQVLDKLIKNGVEARALWYPLNQHKFTTNYESYRVEKSIDLVDTTLNLPSSPQLTVLELNKTVKLINSN